MLENFIPKGQDWTHSSLLTYIGVIALSIWGGLTRWASQEVYTWRSLVAQLLSSSFAGMMVYFGCQYAGISGPLAGVLIGISSHMGTPAIIKFATKFKVVKNLLEETK
jgi:NhaP-type Na+/H+ or K+/H+ antiporter